VWVVPLKREKINVYLRLLPIKPGKMLFLNKNISLEKYFYARREEMKKNQVF